MRRMMTVTVAAWSTLLLLFVGASGGGCAGNAARENVLVPALRATWPRIVENVDRGSPDVATVATREQMTAALEAGTIPGILAVDWPALRRAATAGISDMEKKGEIGPGVAVSLMQRLESFETSLDSLRTGGGVR